MIRSVQPGSVVTVEHDATFTAAAISALVALLILLIERIASAAANRKDLRRQALEDWLSTLAVWVDDHRQKPAEPTQRKGLDKYHQLTNRHVLELRFKRKDKYVAWWMHEMALIILDPQLDASESHARLPDNVLRDVGESLLKWHHRELKSRDFQVPYDLMKHARRSHKAVSDIATELGLSGYESPVRLTARREQQIAKLIRSPKTGGPLLDVLGSFVGRRHLIQAFGFAAANILNTQAKIQLHEVQRAFTRRRMDHLSRRLAKLDDGELPSTADNSENPH